MNKTTITPDTWYLCLDDIDAREYYAKQARDEDGMRQAQIATTAQDYQRWVREAGGWERAKSILDFAAELRAIRAQRAEAEACDVRYFS